ncbi:MULTISPECIES: GNAT family N-acetyltransferase [unclassified Phenylobacterium]|uniref:GNAT family N-acetyltransferase n=1 Tax=unclassified Phenylobacterium TaxID=2640670 RepID=UPI0009E6C16A|nr:MULTISPECIES: GNAT family N-acetyltransferase [unclassified Phenylobacterium]
MTSTRASLRPLTPADMPKVAALQTVAFAPLFHEPQDILASRLTVAPALCWAAFEGEELLAYILSHPWPAASPPPIGTTLSAPPATDNWFIHDLAIGPAARGLGLGRALVASAADAALGAGLVRGDLVAVQGAWRFWEKLGYSPVDDLAEPLRTKVAGYGEDARYMTANIAELKVR